MARSRRDIEVKRPDPNLTAHEMMARTDAEHTVKAAQDLVDGLPPQYKEPLKMGKGIMIRLDKYTVQVFPR